MFINDVLLDFVRLFYNEAPVVGRKIILQRDCKDDVRRHYVGFVSYYKTKPQKTIGIIVTDFYEGGRKINKKSKEISFRVDKSVSLFKPRDFQTSQHLDPERERLRRKRLAYANARTMIAKARTQEETYFDLLGLKPTSTKEDFKRTKKNIMLKWHPDKVSVSNLSEVEFMKKSKQYTDAIAALQKYFK